MKRPKHLAFIRRMPCAACLNDICTEAAHFRASRPGKHQGTGLKPDDKYTNPLCSQCHDKQTNHPRGEEGFWDEVGIDGYELSQRLFSVSGNVVRGESIVREVFYNRQGRLT